MRRLAWAVVIVLSALVLVPKASFAPVGCTTSPDSCPVGSYCPMNGGSCVKGCLGDTNCGSGICVNGSCCTPSDSTNRCGGDCGATCPDCDSCGDNVDCEGGICTNGTCCSPSDSSGCGGTCATSCGTTCNDGGSCTTGSDCENGVCVNSTCCSPSDSSNECGGNCGVRCPLASQCNSNSDCLSGLCNGGVCVQRKPAPAVSNHTAIFVGAGLLLTGLWQVRRRLARR